MLYAVSVAMLGYTRLQSVTVYNSETRAFDELTPAVARRYIKSGQVAGIKWEAEDNYDKGLFVPDKEGFNKQNIMIRTAAGKFRPLYDDKPGQPINSMYNVVRILLTDYRGVLYEIVSNRFDRIKLTEEQLRGLNALEPIAGVWIYDDHIVSAGCIKIEDRRKQAGESVEQAESSENNENSEKPDQVDAGENSVDTESAESAESAQSLTMDDIFGSDNAFVGEQAQTVEGKFGSLEVSDDKQAAESESQVSESESMDADQAEQALEMKPVFQEAAGHEKSKTARSKVAGGKNRKSAANKKK